MEFKTFHLEQNKGDNARMVKCMAREFNTSLTETDKREAPRTTRCMVREPCI